MRATRLALTVLVLVCSAADALAAQEPLEGAPGTLPAGRSVRVVTREGRRIVAPVLAAERESLVLAVEGARVVVSAGAIDSLWLRSRATVPGAVVGGTVAAAGSIVVAALVCQAIREDFPCGESGHAIGVSIFGGLVVGGAIGTAIPRWRLRYARSPESAWGPVLRPRWQVGFSVPLP